MSTCQVLIIFIAWQSSVVESLWFARLAVKYKSTWGLSSQPSATPVELFDVGGQMSPSFSWCILLNLSANSNYCFLNFIRWFIFRVALRICVQLDLWTWSNLHLKKLVCDSRCRRHFDIFVGRRATRRRRKEQIWDGCYSWSWKPADFDHHPLPLQWALGIESRSASEL